MSQKVTVLLMRDYLERFVWNRYEVVTNPTNRRGSSARDGAPTPSTTAMCWSSTQW